MPDAERDIQHYYQSDVAASEYVARRFGNALFLVLHEKQVRAVRAAIAKTRAERILEIAPGPGRITRDVVTSERIVCLEYNRSMLDVGRRACRGSISWVRGNAFALPFREHAFDLVYSFRFVRHFTLDDRRRLYAGVRRVLSPGGVFLMDAVNGRVSRPLRDANPQEYPVYDELYESARALRDELRTEGLKVERLLHAQRRFGTQHRIQCLVGPRSERLSRMAISLLERLSRGEGLEWVVTCRRA